MVKITILTLFPDYFSSVLTTSIIGRAIKSHLIMLQLVNIRDYADNKHKTTDDRPFGGGPGMVMMIEPIDKALKSLNLAKNNPERPIVLLSARGQMFNQSLAQDLSQKKELILICGHYGDVDQRVADYLCDLELRVGDFILTGGEPAASCVVDSVARLIPGVLGNESSLLHESHQMLGQFSPPQYTRPSDYQGWSVPPVLLTGDPKLINQWQKDQAK